MNYFNQVTVNTVGPVEQEQSARMTRQTTRELTSIEEGLLDTTTSVQQDSLPAQVDEQEQMCNEGKKSIYLSLRNGSCVYDCL